MILFYLVDREMINERRLLNNREDVFRLENELEKSLKNIVVFMPPEEEVIISPSFGFESELCRNILNRNMAFVEQGYIKLYMKENSLYDFREKKINRYKKVMEICSDYKDSYRTNQIYSDLAQMPFAKIHKKEESGRKSIEAFEKQTIKLGKAYRIENEIINEIVKVAEGDEKDLFLWENVQNNIQKSGINENIIRQLNIRSIMNESYLTVFNDHNIHLPYHGHAVTQNISKSGLYDEWKIEQVFKLLGIQSIIWMSTAEEIINLRNNLDFQEILYIVRNGIFSGDEILDLCQSINSRYNVKAIIKGILETKGDRYEMNGELRDNTLKMLHLSDLHLTDLKSTDEHYYFLKIDLNQYKIKKIDYLIISGDVSDRPLQEHYQAAVHFCKMLISDYDIDINHVIVTPGNHDCDRDISKAAYDESKKEFNVEKLKERFNKYNQYFYNPLFGRDYPREYEDQVEVCQDVNDKVYILGLNSAFMINHIEEIKSGICFESIMKRTELFDLDKYIKMAVWHHPISGYAAIQNTDFLDVLVSFGFKVCYNGHIHEAKETMHTYDDKHRIRFVGAGTFGAVKEDRGDGIPRQYNLIEIDLKNNKGIVHTRKREKEKGIWMADARWADKNREPRSFYEIEL